MTAAPVSFQELESLNDGLIFLGCKYGQGKYQVILTSLENAGIISSSAVYDVSDWREITTTGGRTDLYFNLFKTPLMDFDRFGIWFELLGDACIHMSRYLTVYKSHHDPEARFKVLTKAERREHIGKRKARQAQNQKEILGFLAHKSRERERLQDGSKAPSVTWETWDQEVAVWKRKRETLMKKRERGEYRGKMKKPRRSCQDSGQKRKSAHPYSLRPRPNE